MHGATGWIFIQLDIWGFLENILRKFKFYSNRRIIISVFTCRSTYFFIITLSFLLRMRNVSDKVVEKIKTHILCSVKFFDSRAVYEIMWKNFLVPDSSQMTT